MDTLQTRLTRNMSYDLRDPYNNRHYYSPFV